jgi:hypothetical protein
VEVELNAGVPLFERLVELCAREEREGRVVRVIGGAAMLIWGRWLDERPSATRDIDCVIAGEDVPDPDAALALARGLVEGLAEMGFGRPEDWKSSRTGRFSFASESEKVAIEFLCGALPVGEGSRREPAWKVAPLPGDGPDFYAARNDWIELVAEWVEATLVCGDSRAPVRVPSLSGLALLKIKAVGDKLERIDEEERVDQVEHEERRLQKHAGDLVLLMGWIDRRGEFAGLVEASRQDGVIVETCRGIAKRLLDDEELAGRLGLESLERGLARLSPPTI